MKEEKLNGSELVHIERGERVQRSCARDARGVVKGRGGLAQEVIDVGFVGLALG